jgi:hypothetical protein
MHRFIGVAFAILLALGIAAPIAIAADPLTDDTSVLIAFDGDVTVEAGDEVGAVIVTGGTATVRGTVNAVLVLDGQAVFEGARVDSLAIVGGTVALDAASIVTGDIRTLDATVERAEGAQVGGSVRGLEADLLAVGLALAPVFILFAIGLAVATVVAGLALAALAARQVRAAEDLIRTEPGSVVVAGFLGLIVTPLIGILAIVTVVGAPLGIGLMVVAWPAVAYLGYLVAGIFIGDWMLDRMRGGPRAERPYAAAVVGLIVLQIIGLIPLVGAIASLFGFGAVVLLGWRTFRAGRGGEAVEARSAAQPLGA